MMGLRHIISTVPTYRRCPHPGIGQASCRTTACVRRGSAASFRTASCVFHALNAELLVAHAASRACPNALSSGTSRPPHTPAASPAVPPSARPPCSRIARNQITLFAGPILNRHDVGFECRQPVKHAIQRHGIEVFCPVAQVHGAQHQYLRPWPRHVSIQPLQVDLRLRCEGQCRNQSPGPFVPFVYGNLPCVLRELVAIPNAQFARNLGLCH